MVNVKVPTIVRNGTNNAGTPQYKCKDCGTCRVLKSKHKTRHLAPELLYRTYQERNSLRATGRILGISHGTVFYQLKKSPGLSSL